MDSARSPAVLNSRFTGPGSAWEKAKERAALHQKSALRSAAEYGNLPSDYCALKGDYTRVSNATGNPYIDSGPGIQDPAKIPPVNYPNVHPPNEKAVSDYLLNRGAVPQYVRPQIEEKSTSPNIKNYPCVEEGQKQYDFLSQTPGITRDNLAIPKPELKETNYQQMPRAKDFQPPSALNQKLYKPEGRIGVEHSLNKSFQNTPKPWDRYTSPEMGISKFSGDPQTPSPSHDYPKKDSRQESATPGEYQKYTQSPTMTDYPPEGRYSQFKEEIPQYKEPEMQYKQTPDMYQQVPEMSQKIPEMQKPQTQNINLSELHKVEPTFESQALKGLKRIRTTNQTYGSWIGDPFLEGKDWYRSPRFPHVKSYLTKHKEESGSWM